MNNKITNRENGSDGTPSRDLCTWYRISSVMKDQKSKKWVRISFHPSSDTTLLQHFQKKRKTIQQPTSADHQKISSKQNGKEGDSSESIPESVLQYERQMRKLRAADRASKTDVNARDHLHTVYFDDHIVVTNKPSGILCVPGVNKNKSLLDLVFDKYGSGANDEDEKSTPSATSFPRDSMIVHRLDMDTSGIVMFARTRTAMSALHKLFRERTGTKKVYEALLVGWLDIDPWIESIDENDGQGVGMKEGEETEEDQKPPKSVLSNVGILGGGEIHLPLQRDHRHPPFMRVSTPESEAEARRAVEDLNHAGYKKLIAKKPKASTTQFRIISHEQWFGHPVTRVELIPITGRTHQLRAHCAAMGHPILGDPAYGFCGEAHPNGGFSDNIMNKISPTCAAFELRRDAEGTVREKERTMCLHARQLTIDHPVTRKQMSFEVAPSF